MQTLKIFLTQIYRRFSIKCGSYNLTHMTLPMTDPRLLQKFRFENAASFLSWNSVPYTAESELCQIESHTPKIAPAMKIHSFKILISDKSL